MLIAQITDTHIKPKGGLAYGNVLDSASCLKNVVNHCNEFNPTIDLVFVTGDLTDSGRLEEYEEFNKILRDLKIPWFVIPGNHDNKQILMNFFDEHEYLPRNENFVIIGGGTMGGGIIPGIPGRGWLALKTAAARQNTNEVSVNNLRWYEIRLGLPSVSCMGLSSTHTVEVTAYLLVSSPDPLPARKKSEENYFTRVEGLGSLEPRPSSPRFYLAALEIFSKAAR